MKYCFFSRKNGFIDGTPIKYFKSSNFNDPKNDTKYLIDKSGKDILTILKDTNSKLLNNDFIDLVTAYENWYYYPISTIISDCRTFE